MFAVIRTGGKQYKVSEGETLDIELLPEDQIKEGKATLGEVLLCGEGEDVKIGTPLVSGASVEVDVVEEEVKAPKVIAYKFKRRKGYHRTVGHRQKHNRVKVTKISA